MPIFLLCSPVGQPYYKENITLHFLGVMIYYLVRCFIYNLINFLSKTIVEKGAKGDSDFLISDLVKNPDGTDI